MILLVLLPNVGKIRELSKHKATLERSEKIILMTG
jgi:hypothetical protein